jgi:CRP-like cAMP-binding protein
MRLVRRAKNQIIYSQGDPAEMLYLLFEGQLKVSKEADLFR